MVIFLNFAPIDFMGGAERWMNDTAKEVAKKEKTYLASVDRSIANYYGKLVLKREFTRRATKDQLHKNHLNLTFTTFLPFTKKWKNARSLFRKSRIIYAKYEVLELAIIMYFGGISSVKKTVAGIHSPFLYSRPHRFMDTMHNKVYGSGVNKAVLGATKTVHVLNRRDKKLMSKDFHLDNVAYVPNSIRLNAIRGKRLRQTTKLNILFVGELSTRKGIDVFINTIRNSPEHFHFTMVGDGEKKEIIKSIGDIYRNCTYAGYVSKKEITNIYRNNDVLFLPSRAESMSLVILEALSHGLVIVNSEEISLNLPKDIEYSHPNNAKSYLPTLHKLYKKKIDGKLNRKYIQDFCKENFSSRIILPKLMQNVFRVGNG